MPEAEIVSKSLIGWYLEPWKKYAEFSGRATRREFWAFAPPILFCQWFVLTSRFAYPEGTPLFVLPFVLVAGLYSLATFIPWLAVGFRRLQDNGRNGMWVIMSLIPCLGLILFIFYLQEGDPGSNSYGPDPRVRRGNGSMSMENELGGWGSGEDVDA